ncbi:MAG: hypothetical protein LBB12_03330 [Holosporaceae bacterium]|nr:hypothetical protein [Holosporaceae bacterium]
MFKSFYRLSALSMLLLANNVMGCYTLLSHIEEYSVKYKIEKKDIYYDDFGTGITAGVLENIMCDVLDCGQKFPFSGKVIILPDEINSKDPWLLRMLIKRSLFHLLTYPFRDYSQSLKTPNTDTIKLSCDKALEELTNNVPRLKNNKSLAGVIDSVYKLLSQGVIQRYFQDNFMQKKYISAQRVVSTADVYTFLKCCFPRLYESNVEIHERSDYEGSLKGEYCWDGSKPQFFEATIDGNSYVVKSTWRAFEYGNCVKLYNFLEKDGKRLNKNGLVAYPKKIALYDIKGVSSAEAATVEIFANVATSKLTESVLEQSFFKNNSNCCYFDSICERYKFNMLSRKTIFQLMPMVNGESLDWFFNSGIIQSPQFSYSVGKKCADALADLHSLGYDKDKKCTTSMHGDFHRGNFLYDIPQDKITIIDVGLERQNFSYCQNGFGFNECDNDFSRLLNVVVDFSSRSLSELGGSATRKNDLLFMEGILSRYQQKNPSLFQCFFDLNDVYSRRSVGYYDIHDTPPRRQVEYIFPQVTQYMIFVFHYCKGRSLESDDPLRAGKLPTEDEIVADILNLKSMRMARLLFSDIKSSDKLSICQKLSKQDRITEWQLASSILKLVNCVENYLNDKGRSLETIEKVLSLYYSKNALLGTLPSFVIYNDEKFNIFMTNVAKKLEN